MHKCHGFDFEKHIIYIFCQYFLRTREIHVTGHQRLQPSTELECRPKATYKLQPPPSESAESDPGDGRGVCNGKYGE